MIGALRDDGALAKELVRVAFRQAERVTELRFDTLHLLAVLADKHQKLDEAERFYRQSLRSSGPGTEALVYGGLLRVLWKEHKYEDVVQVCREALQKVQGASPVFLHGEMARAQARLGKTDEALQSAERALQVAGDADKLILNRLRVSILIQAERFDEAEKDCRELLKQFRGPGDSNDIHYLLSNVYSASRQMAKAEQELENILKTDPNNATVNNDLGYIWADQNKNLDKAEEMVRLAIELDRRQRKLSRDPAADEQQDNAAYIDSLGWVYFRQGKLEDACRELERSSALPDGADDPTVWDHLGDVYFRLQRAADARSAWEKSARLFEKENRRRMDERHKEVLRKLKEVGK
jgi:tetratricopeptide (TPR) repeat protein